MTLQGDARAGASTQLATAKGMARGCMAESTERRSAAAGRPTHQADGIVGLCDDVAGRVAGRRADGRQRALQARQEGARARVQPPHHLPPTSLIGAACTSVAAHAPAAFISDEAPFLYIQELTMCRMKR